jgi:hypothetical protein
MNLTPHIPNPIMAMIGASMVGSNDFAAFDVSSVNWGTLATGTTGSATVTLTAKPGYDFTGVNESNFNHESANNIKILNNTGSTIELEMNFKSFTLAEALDKVLNWPKGAYSRPADKTYSILLGTDNDDFLPVKLAPTTEDMTIVLTGNNKTIAQADYSRGSLFTVSDSLNHKMTLEIGGSISLYGTFWHSKRYNTHALITVRSNATLVLKDNVSLADNRNLNGLGGGVYVGNGSTLIMKGEAKIYKNRVRLPVDDEEAPTAIIGEAYGGGVYVDGGTLTMDDASEISENNTDASTGFYGYGGGVYLKDAVFNFNNGKIANNIAGDSFEQYKYGFGGGVYVDTGSTFIKTGGELDDDNVAENGKVIFVAKPDGSAAATKTTTVASDIDLSAVWDNDDWDFTGAGSASDYNWDTIIP